MDPNDPMFADEEDGGRAQDDLRQQISAAMLEGTGLIEVKKKFPDRVYDVGIAEEHAVIMAGGMAKAGLKPVVAIYSTFLQRSYDQLIHDVALCSLPVTVCIDRAGLVGDDGKTHQGIFDIAYTRTIPNLTVAAPKDENELQHLLHTAIESGRPYVLRYPRGVARWPRTNTRVIYPPAPQGSACCAHRVKQTLPAGAEPAPHQRPLPSSCAFPQGA